MNNKILIRSIAFLMTGSSLLFFVMRAASAAGLVPCNGTDCNICSLFQLGKNVIDFLWWQISFPLAVLMLVVGAFLFIISGGNPSLHTKAKSVVTAAVVGLFITFASWLIVSTVINAFANTGSFPWPWNQPNCPDTSSSSSGNITCTSARGVCYLSGICPVVGTGIAVPSGDWSDCQGGACCSTVSCASQSGTCYLSGVCPVVGTGLAVPVGGWSDCQGGACCK